MKIEKPIAVIGTNSWGSALYEKALRGDAVDDLVIKDAVSEAIRQDLLIFDTAQDYGLGKGQKMIGAFCPADQTVISAKYTPGTKYKPGQVHASLEKDLKDFGRDSVDIYWLHLPNCVEENMKEIMELYREGKIRYVGISNFNLKECMQVKKMLDDAGIPLYGVQNHYSLLSRDWEEKGLTAWCRENGVSFWAWAVLEEGILAGPRKKDEKNTIMKAIFSRKRRKLQRLFRLMKIIGDRHNITIAQVAIAYVANKGLVPICGCRKPYQVAQLKEAAQTKLSAKEMKKLEEIADESGTKILGADNFRSMVKEPKIKTSSERTFSVEKDGFHGAWFPYSGQTSKGVILMLGDSSKDWMAVSGAKCMNRMGCHALTMSPDEKDYGHHNYPLERFGKAIAFLKENGCEKIGIAGASTTGMLALLAASYYPEDISLTLALSPCDFVMEGFYQDGKDGAHERPGENESTVSWQGKPLPYLPFAYRHPEYWQKLSQEAKDGGNMVASREMFEESERRHPLQEEEMIRVENIRGQIILVGAEDDVLWNTCKYIRRMQERLEKLPHDSELQTWTYQHGTHFIFPESMIRIMLPVGSGLLVSLAFKAGRRFPKECRAARIDIDRKLRDALLTW